MAVVRNGSPQPAEAKKEYKLMNLRSLFRGNDANNGVEERAAMISRYQQLRAVGRTLNNKLVQRLSNDVLHEGGKKLGIVKNGTFVFDSEDETSVLMDFCIYDVHRKGRNCVEQYLADSPPDADSDEMVCLRAMQRATYSLFIVESVERGLGVTVRDLRSNKTILVVEMDPEIWTTLFMLEFGPNFNRRGVSGTWPGRSKRHGRRHRQVVGARRSRRGLLWRR
jgi:hypothetical protein